MPFLASDGRGPGAGRGPECRLVLLFRLTTSESVGMRGSRTARATSKHTYFRYRRPNKKTMICFTNLPGHDITRIIDKYGS